MKICFTLDDVIRAKTQQIGKMYQKYIKRPRGCRGDEFIIYSGTLFLYNNMNSHTTCCKIYSVVFLTKLL